MNPAGEKDDFAVVSDMILRPDFPIGNFAAVEFVPVHADVQRFHRPGVSGKGVDEDLLRPVIAHQGPVQAAFRPAGQPGIAALAPVPLLHVDVVDHRHLGEGAFDQRQQIIAIVGIGKENGMDIPGFDQLQNEIGVFLRFVGLGKDEHRLRLLLEAVPPPVFPGLGTHHDYGEGVLVDLFQNAQVEPVRASQFHPGNQHEKIGFAHIFHHYRFIYSSQT